MELMAPFTKPSRTFQGVCAYWLTSSAGFSASAPGHTANSNAAMISPARTAPSALLSGSRRLPSGRRSGVREHGGNRQLDLGARIEFTPDGQFAADEVGAFVHARK